MTANQTKSKSKRRDKADRNTTTWTVPQSDSDTKYNIDSIVAFIENKDNTTKKANLINVNNKNNNNNLKTTENRKEKQNKNSTNNKKDVNRLKKSTSMEELKSSSKIEEEREIAQSEREKVSLRQKQIQQNAQKRTAAIDSAKDLKQQANQQQPNKRGERRSWGTEELNYLGERDADERDAKKPKEKSKINKKPEQTVSNQASVESIPMSIEAAEFHVVTKKKKTKKRQIFEEAKAKQQQIHQRDSTHTGRNTHPQNANNKYQPSSSYTNDRDVYMNSLTTKENRRKSTSSMPPSDKSDSSDLDSIHSLPIESTQTCTPIISYAEIARKANPVEKMTNHMNAWPTVTSSAASSVKNANETPEASNVSTCSSTLSAKSQGQKSSPSTDEKTTTTVTMDDTKHFDTPKASETAKNQLQKSKSCDNDKYVTTMSLDQFPGLEKTVKPQKSHPNFASVLTSPPVAKGQQQQQSAKKTIETNGAKENATKSQKSTATTADDKPETKVVPAAEFNQTKLVFVQNNAKAEEIANSSDASNLFVTLNASVALKRGKKQMPSINSLTSTAYAKTALQHSQRTAAVIFSDRETSHENVSPLLFGDFNDDILQLMKQDGINDNVRGGGGDGDMATKQNDLTPITSSKSDPGYASNTSESHAVSIDT